MSLYIHILSTDLKYNLKFIVFVGDFLFFGFGFGFGLPMVTQLLRTICGKIALPPCNCYHTLVKTLLGIFVCVCFWILYFVPLICVPVSSAWFH